MTAIDNATPPRTRTCARPRVLTAAALALILALTGCGGSAKPAKQKAGGTGASTGAVAGSTAASSPTAAAPGSGSQQSATNGGNFCSLVSAEEAHAIVDTDLAPGKSRIGSGPAGQGGSCLYNAAKPVNTAPTVVNVLVLGTKYPRAIYEKELKNDPEGAPHTPVPGLGEDAFASPGLVTAFDQGLVLAIEVIKGGRPVDVASIVALMRKALSRAGSLK